MFQIFFAVTKDKQLKGVWIYFGTTSGPSVHSNGENGIAPGQEGERGREEKTGV